MSWPWKTHPGGGSGGRGGGGRGPAGSRPRCTIACCTLAHRTLAGRILARCTVGCVCWQSGLLPCLILPTLTAEESKKRCPAKCLPPRLNKKTDGQTRPRAFPSMGRFGWPETKTQADAPALPSGATQPSLPSSGKAMPGLGSASWLWKLLSGKRWFSSLPRSLVPLALLSSLVRKQGVLLGRSLPPRFMHQPADDDHRWHLFYYLQQLCIKPVFAQLLRWLCDLPAFFFIPRHSTLPFWSPRANHPISQLGKPHQAYLANSRWW